MGGYGSGRPAIRTTEASTWALVLDVLHIMRPFAAPLRQHIITREVTLNARRLAWTRGGEPYAEVEYAVTIYPDGDSGVLRVRHGDVHGYGHPPQDYPITLATTCPPYGGRQWWFLCPVTGRRSRKLFLPNGGARFACRQAYRLRYHTQRVGRVERAQRRIGRICQRLGGEWRVMAADLPPKPKWMRWATYRRFEAKAWAADDIALDAILAGTERLTARLERWKR